MTLIYKYTSMPGVESNPLPIRSFLTIPDLAILRRSFDYPISPFACGFTASHP